MLLIFLLILSIYLPFQLALNPAPGIDLASVRVFILFIFFLWLAESLRKKSLKIENSAVTAFVAVFLFLNLFSFFFAQNTAWAGRKLLYIFSIFPIYFVASSVINSREKIGKIMKALVFSGAIAALIGIFQFLFQFIFGLESFLNFWKNYFTIPFLGRTFAQSVFEYSSWLVNISGQTYFRAISVFPDPHMFSLYLGLLLPIALFLFFASKNKLWMISFFLILFADLLTFSRGGYLGILGAAVFLFFVQWKRMNQKYKLGALIGALLIIIFISVPNPITARFFSSFNLHEGSNAGRLEMWEAAEKVISQKPVFGAGLGNFPLAVDPLAGYREPIYAHNAYLDIAAETGLPSAIAWIAILLFSIKNFLKKSKDDMLFLGIASGLFIFSVHSLFETGIYSPVVLTLFLVIISLNDQVSVKNLKEKNI